MVMADASPLTTHDWALAALTAVASGGVDNVTVEGLARELGVTKGSFYWHFADRSALIDTALALWEQEGTTDVIAALREIPDPAVRLRRLFDLSFGDEIEGPVDAALVARVDDAVVGPVVRRVTATRIAFLEELFRDLGLTPARAAARARIAYCTYVGHHQVRRSLPRDAVLASPSRSYFRHVLAMLTTH